MKFYNNVSETFAQHSKQPVSYHEIKVQHTKATNLLLGSYGNFDTEIVIKHFPNIKLLTSIDTSLLIYARKTICCRSSNY